MLTDSKVTIVIPTFNRADRVSNAIKSALQQTVKCRVVVVDHGSSDNTPTIMQKFGSEITYIRNEDDFGPIYSWIDGVVRANTEFVKILFDDDVLAPTFVAESLSLMGPDTAFVASNARVVDLDSGKTIIESLFGGFRKPGVFRCSGLKGAWVSKLMISPSALLLRRSDLLDGLYLGSLPLQTSKHHGAGPDHFVKLLAMTRYSNFGLISESLVDFGAHSGSITIQASGDRGQRENLHSVYTDVWIYYLQLRLLKFLRIPFRITAWFVATLERLILRMIRLGK